MAFGYALWHGTSVFTSAWTFYIMAAGPLGASQAWVSTLSRLVRESAKVAKYKLDILNLLLVYKLV
jgi:hypothetical protein